MSHDDDPIGGQLPSWLTDYGAELRRIGEAVNEHGSLRNAVIYFVATWIVGGILMLGRTVVDSILLAFDVVLVLGLEPVANQLVEFLDMVGLPLLNAATGVPAFFAELVEPFGPLAPFVGAVSLAVIFVLVYRAAKAILLEIPLLGGLLEFLGVDI